MNKYPAVNSILSGLFRTDRFCNCVRKTNQCRPATETPFWQQLNRVLWQPLYIAFWYNAPHANRYTRPENLAWSHSVFIQYSLCIKCRFMKPLLLSSIANTQSIPPTPHLNLISKSYHVNCPKVFHNLPCCKGWWLPPLGRSKSQGLGQLVTS